MDVQSTHDSRLPQAVQSTAARNPDAAQDASEAAFGPWMAYMSEQQAQRSAARDIAQANRMAQARERVTESDLRRADPRMRRTGSHTEPQPAPSDPAAAESAFPDNPVMVGTGGVRALHGTLPAHPAPHGAAPVPGSADPSSLHTRGSLQEQHENPATPPQRAARTGSGALGAIGPQSHVSASAVPVAAAGDSSSVARGHAPSGGTHSGGDAHGTASGRTPDGRRGIETARTTPPARELSQADTRRTVDGILRVLKARTSQGRAVVKLQLSPPELGRLTIDMRLERDSMHIRIVTGSGAVRDAIQGSAGFLSDALQELGISVQRLEVEVQEHTDNGLSSAEDEASRNPVDPEPGQRRASSEGDGGADDNAPDHGREALESRLEAELPADVFIPGRVDITA